MLWKVDIAVGLSRLKEFGLQSFINLLCWCRQIFAVVQKKQPPPKRKEKTKHSNFDLGINYHGNNWSYEAFGSALHFGTLMIISHCLIRLEIWHLRPLEGFVKIKPVPVKSRRGSGTLDLEPELCPGHRVNRTTVHSLPLLTSRGRHMVTPIEGLQFQDNKYAFWSLEVAKHKWGILLGIG